MHNTLTLLDIESTFIARHMASISTITFFEGSLEEVQTEIYERLEGIVKENPWLCGTLNQEKGQKRLQLHYPNSPKKEDIKKLFEVNPKALAINSAMPYESLAKTLRPYLVKSPSEMINKESAVTRLILLSDDNKASNKFALLFSLSHSVADGHSYYNIFNMLSVKATISPLEVKRKESVMPQLIDAFGQKQYAYLKSIPHVINVFKGIFLGNKSQPYLYYVDEKKIQHLKEEVKKNHSLDFVSTNDILTSTFSNFIKSRITVMAINFRNKLEGLSDKDAGNYEGAVLYDKETYAQPLGIRKSLASQPYVGLKRSLPSFFEGMFCQMGLITNWASFCEELYFQNCEQTLHLPITNSGGNAPYEMAVVFRPRAGKLGILYFSKIFTSKEFRASQLPIGENI